MKTEAIKETIVANPDKQEISISHPVNVLAHIKSPRINAPTKLRTDTRAQMPATFRADMLAMLSRR
jgi:hypothetical protein